jgi:hypothetical protein
MSVGDHATQAILDWLARIGPGTQDELAAASGLSGRATRTRLAATDTARLTRSCRLLHASPELHVITRRGLRVAGRPELEPTAISAAGFAHLVAVARVAGALEAAGHRVGGERELRAFERAEGRALASAEVGMALNGGIALHRPDLVLWGAEALPIAIEVELTVKAPERLAAIVRGWARSRITSGVLYYATPSAARALARAVRSEFADGRVVALGLDRAGEVPVFRTTSSIPSSA